MKRKILIAAVILISTIRIFAQSPGPKWEKVFEAKDQTVYVDTSSIKKFENQITVLSITVYKKPQIITSLGKEATSIKTQLLFNSNSRKYTVIGTLYYDKNQKILGETSLPGFASGSENFSIQIEGNETMTAIFNKAVEYLGIETGIVEQKDSSQNTNNTNKLAVKEQEEKSNDDPSKTLKNENNKSNDRVALYLSKKDSVQKVTAPKEDVKSIPTRPIIDKTKNPSESKQTTNLEKQKPVIDSRLKELPVGTNPKEMIFKEGTKYSFQVSSWKNKPKAEKEVQRLKAKGHNAFLTEGTLRGVKWYRVRIGYFNSLEETEEYKKKIN
ncbi:MAG: SPOR domain-containing protein [Ignavibacteriales bacterium]|nr:SPOR domain-containing protein [Ignavibacteriales bacterium]